MNILLLLIPLSLLLLGAAVAAFVWAVRRGQFDDLDTPALDILADNDRPVPVPVPLEATDARAAAAETSTLSPDAPATSPGMPDTPEATDAPANAPTVSPGTPAMPAGAPGAADAHAPPPADA